ncbi:MAG: hypothetical protein DRJ51_06835 [Thermoprotei archaeon]|nr:MAG: hypothetical protein DRJ51_06835 [Thermoprotei archaeon]
MRIIQARSLVKGRAEGEALVSTEPISFFGGVDPETGVVIEKGHPLEKVSIAGKILVFPHGKGSTVGSYVIYRLSKVGRAPKAIINLESEPIIIIGCILSGIVLVDKPEENVIEVIRTGDKVIVNARNKIALIKVIRDR